MSETYRDMKIRHENNDWDRSVTIFNSYSNFYSYYINKMNRCNDPDDYNNSDLAKFYQDMAERTYKNMQYYSDKFPNHLKMPTKEH